MQPRQWSKYAPMLGYLVRLKSGPDPVRSWAQALAWVIAAWRCRMARGDVDYLALAECLKADAKIELRRRAADRQRVPIRVLTLPPAVHIGHIPVPAWEQQIAHQWLAEKGSGGMSQRATIRPKPEPVPISATIVPRGTSDSQTVIPGHLLHPDEVYELAATLNARRL